MSGLIDREAAKKKYCQICQEEVECFTTPEQCNYLKAFDDIPDDGCPYYIPNKHDRGDDSLCRKTMCEASAERPIGHWIHLSRCDECSECGYTTGRYNPASKFCPDCGAKMQGW